MRQCYEKLVRDRIPEIMEREGIRYEIEVLTEELYWEALRKKLVEEAHEVATAGPDELIHELADVHEVLEALQASHGITPDEVDALRKRRREERGGFARKIFLRWTD
ncbi:MAG: nucleoside triphosphate pyrophosphohydrolase [Truepera sp.]|nr:nucleoside triphosphate pyrophosphohydrolase [Truepera sp.]